LNIVDSKAYTYAKSILEHRPPPNRAPTVEIGKAVYAKYFNPNQSAKEIQDIVEKALELYFSKLISAAKNYWRHFIWI